MSLPPGFLDELRSRSSLAAVVGRKVIWDQRKSNQGKGDMWAPCPFHQEKTASFHVDDRQGFYYCFGCHAKGDAISFIRETENVGFIESIELLAAEVGMQVPARDPQAQAKAEKRAGLSEVMEMAVQYYRLQLKTAAATDARDYLARRGLREATQDKFGIGFAPDDRHALWAHLTGKGIGPDQIIDAGLAARPDDGGAPYDRFRGRIMFPIRDARDRCIAFGGRAMAADARAKYLNSPETTLFDKGRSLYNQGPARVATGKGGQLIIAEGYMDVIALVEGGFEASVAPLGTAITESQLQLMWRIHPEPIIALDGDTAGMRAAIRLIDLALPLLEPGQSLRFAIMPDGLDPDDLIRSRGAGAVQKLLDNALPMVRLLWQRETQGQVFDSPERKAALEKKLRQALQQIQDRSIRGHYGQEIKQLLWELFRAPARNSSTTGRKWQPGAKPPPARPMTTTLTSLLGSGGAAAAGDRLRESVILATLIANPEILPDFESELQAMELTTPDLRAVHGALLRCLDCEAGALRSKVHEIAGGEALEKLFGSVHVQIAAPVRNPGDAEMARMSVAQELAKLAARRGAEKEIAEAEQDMGGQADEGTTWRLGQAAEARNLAEKSETEDSAEYEAGDNGAHMNRSERSAFEQLLGKIEFGKRQKHN